MQHPPGPLAMSVGVEVGVGVVVALALENGSLGSAECEVQNLTNEWMNRENTIYQKQQYTQTNAK